MWKLYHGHAAIRSQGGYCSSVVAYGEKSSCALLVRCFRCSLYSCGTWLTALFSFSLSSLFFSFSFFFVCPVSFRPLTVFKAKKDTVGNGGANPSPVKCYSVYSDATCENHIPYYFFFMYHRRRKGRDFLFDLSAAQTVVVSACHLTVIVMKYDEQGVSTLAYSSGIEECDPRMTRKYPLDEDSPSPWRYLSVGIAS
ncbi:hypothetical protein BKA56DRAFT_598672 [Ilyonectria sp. MPI-CAGE-AT-0026]|nr:hypothetical protein BKA56DRAFT_598672 [Ilyonectria sp. MPI-CAGE-AT-0026]